MPFVHSSFGVSQVARCPGCGAENQIPPRRAKHRLDYEVLMECASCKEWKHFLVKVK